MALPVLVVGAGPVGLTLACELDRLGVEHRIVDAAADRGAVSRATDLHARSLEVWDAVGAGEAIAAAGLPIAGVPLLSGGREVAGSASPASTAGSRPPSASPSATSRRSWPRACRGRSSAGGRPRWPGRRTSPSWPGVGGERMRASFVVACDGVHSRLREAAGIPFEGGDYPGPWAVMDAEVDGWPYGPAEIPVFLDGDGFWAMPLPGGRLRLFFRDDAAGEAPEVADAQAVIDRHVLGGASIRTADNRACFGLHHRVARRYRAGRVLLAGDAAHAMTPVNGQGMNTGVQDAANLARKLRLALDGAPPVVLDSYEAERRPVAVAAVEGSGAVHEANLLTGEAAAARDLSLVVAFAAPARGAGGRRIRPRAGRRRPRQPDRGRRPPGRRRPHPQRPRPRRGAPRAPGRLGHEPATCCATRACSSGSPPA